jgi:hypothetical protein
MIACDKKMRLIVTSFKDTNVVKAFDLGYNTLDRDELYRAMVSARARGYALRLKEAEEIIHIDTMEALIIELRLL